MAKDLFHEQVKKALQKGGWIITHDPLRIKADDLTGFQIDLSAGEVIGAELEDRKIAVEIKSFINQSAISDFHQAIGQFINYRYALEDFEPERILYLAVPIVTYKSLFQRPFVQSVVKRSQINLMIYDPEQEEIVEWLS